MATIIQSKFAGGPGLPVITQSATDWAAALAAMQAADVRMLFAPVNDLIETVSGTRYMQDVLKAQVEYLNTGTAPTIATGPTQYGTGGAPSATLGGISGVRGWRGNQAGQFAAFGEIEAGEDPPHWGFVVAKVGTDTGARVLFNSDPDATGYGDCLLVLDNESIEFRAGGSDAVTGFGIEGTPSAWHLYEWHYTPSDDMVRFWRDGVAGLSYVVQTSMPGAHFVGGVGQLCGRAASSNIDPHDGTNAAIGIVAVGNGVMSDAGRTTVRTTLKTLYSIP